MSLPSVSVIVTCTFPSTFPVTPLGRISVPSAPISISTEVELVFTNSFPPTEKAPLAGTVAQYVPSSFLVTMICSFSIDSTTMLASQTPIFSPFSRMTAPCTSPLPVVVTLTFVSATFAVYSVPLRTATSPFCAKSTVKVLSPAIVVNTSLSVPLSIVFPFIIALPQVGMTIFIFPSAIFAVKSLFVPQAIVSSPIFAEQLDGIATSPFDFTAMQPLVLSTILSPTVIFSPLSRMTDPAIREQALPILICVSTALVVYSAPLIVTIPPFSDTVAIKLPSAEIATFVALSFPLVMVLPSIVATPRAEIVISPSALTIISTSPLFVIVFVPTFIVSPLLRTTAPCVSLIVPSSETSITVLSLLVVYSLLSITTTPALVGIVTTSFLFALSLATLIISPFVFLGFSITFPL